MPTTDLSTLLAELDAYYARIPHGRSDWASIDPVAVAMVVNAWPQLREALRSLTDANETIAAQDRAAREWASRCTALAALVAQQREAMRRVLAFDWGENDYDAVEAIEQMRAVLNVETSELRTLDDQWREKWNATLDREARRNAEILQLKAANNEMREVLLTLSTADPKLLAEQPEMTAGIARMALQLANHWAAKGSVDAA